MLHHEFLESGPRKNARSPKLERGRRLLQLLDLEGVNEPGPSNVLFELAIASLYFGDVAKAACFARRYLESTVARQGTDDPALLMTIQMVDNLDDCKAYNRDGPWKSQQDDVPVGLDETAFEDWLWNAPFLHWCEEDKGPLPVRKKRSEFYPLDTGATAEDIRLEITYRGMSEEETEAINQRTDAEKMIRMIPNAKQRSGTIATLQE